MSYGKGYLRDPDDHQRTPFARHYAASLPASSLPLDVDNRPNAPAVKDQGSGDYGTGSCTGHGTSGAVSLTCRSKGMPLPFEPSELGIYTVGRCVDRVPDATGALPPLEDIGAMPNQVERGIALWGVRPSRAPSPDGRNSDAAPENVNAEPSLADLEQDATRLLLGSYAIGLYNRVEETKKAIAAGVGVGVGFDVDQAFEDYDGRGPVTMPKQGIGGHWVYLVGYRTDRATGETIFIGRNSWGVDWGGSMRGDFEADESWLIAAFDVIALDVRVPASK